MHIQRHQQLFRHDPDNGVYGDCFRTAVACVLCIEPATVPHVCDGPDDGKANERMQEFLKSVGCRLIGVPFNGDCDLDHILLCGETFSAGLPWLLTGQSRNGTNHVVICQDNKIIHDTSIDQSGIVSPTTTGFWFVEWIVRPAIPLEAVS